MEMKYMTIGEVSAYLQLSEETLYKYVRQGLIPAAKIGRHWRFERNSLDAWVAAKTQGNQPAAGSSARSSLNILIIDDDAAIRQLLVYWIKAAGHRAETAENGDVAMELIGAGVYDLIFLDLQLPGLTGGQVLGRLQENLRRPPVILITGYSETPIMAQALNYDPLYVLAKPFEREQVLKLIQIVQARSREDEHSIQRGGKEGRSKKVLTADAGNIKGASV